jgi:hypothetical protein
MSATVAAPVATEPPIGRTALENLSIATTEAIDASAQLEAARIRMSAAQQALRSAWAAVDGTSDPGSMEVPALPRIDAAPVSPAEAPQRPRVVRTAEEEARSRQNGTAAMLAGRAHRTTRAKGEDGLTPRQREVLDAALATDGDRKAASVLLGTSVMVVEATLETVGKKRLLPTELIAKLPPRYAKYAPQAVPA